jgi:hypothetical protein
MTTFLILLTILLVGALVIFTLMKTGKIEDKDGNNIPDVIDTKIEETKEIIHEVKVRAKRVKEEVGDVIIAVKEVGKQSKGIAKAVKGEKRAGRKPDTKKTNSPKKKK